MHAFAALLDALIYTRSRLAKLKLIGDYLRATPDPDRGWAMAALTGDLDLPHVKGAVIRALIEERIDPVLFRMSRDYVGDTAETVSLLWPTPPVPPIGDPLSVTAVVDTLTSLSRSDAPAALAAMLDRLDADERFALLKMATGELRVGVSSRLAKTALAEAFESLAVRQADLPLEERHRQWEAAMAALRSRLCRASLDGGSPGEHIPMLD